MVGGASGETNELKMQKWRDGGFEEWKTWLI